MSRLGLRPFAAALAAGLGLGLAASGGGAPATPATPTPAPSPACAGVAPPKRINRVEVPLPASFITAHLGGLVVSEAVIGRDGAVTDVRPVRARFANLAPFGQKTVQDTKFSAGSIDGNPAALRVRVPTTIGIPGRARKESEYDLVWAYAAAGQSREAVWQLAGSVEKLTLSAHLGTAPAQGGSIRLVSPDGTARALRKIAPSPAPVDVSETVSVGKAFDKPGDYRVELEAGGKTLAWTTLTIADDFTRAVVNLCEPIPEKR